MQVCSESGKTQAPHDEYVDDHGPEIGLGIDAGGTYTDAVIFDFKGDDILAKSKALTTKWDYTEGIEAALDQLPDQYLEKVGLVSVSTTLATNAIVENRGQKVGLLLMPPHGIYDESELTYTPMAIVQGQMDMDGTVLAPVDPMQIESVARAMIREHQVKAFAVSGCGATINATHELEVAEILQRTTGLSVTCGHTLSDMLGVYRRATTAIFNAQVVPFIETFLQTLRIVLTKRHIDAPVMVVKGDGTLMSAAMAKDRPVETIFSGPAASVAGATRLTHLADALVIDIGGTTTDIAAIENSRVAICPKGNVVGGVRTHVKALNMITKGLGGDSAITLAGQEVHIGPVRVTPVSFLARQFPATSQAISFIEEDTDAYRMDPRMMQLLALSSHKEAVALEPVEKDILEVLAQRPYSIEELTQTLDLPYRGIGLFARLLREGMICVSTLTPTDLLHAEDRIQLWDGDTARRVCDIYADMLRCSREAFIRLALDTFTRELALELIRKLMNHETDSDAMDSSRAFQWILRRWLRPTDNHLAIDMKLPYPLIGVGAPAGEFLPEVARLFNTMCVIPHDHDVANAIGAITSTISVSRTVKIAPKESGYFAIMGLADGRDFVHLKEAVDCGKAQLIENVLALAYQSGILNPVVETTMTDDIAANGYGGELFLGTIITASVTGKPRGADAPLRR